MIRVSPSLLESYRLFLTEDWFTVEKMRDDISKEFTPTPQIMLGNAYHKMVENFTNAHEMYAEHGNPGEKPMLVEQDGYLFQYEPCTEPVRDFLDARCVHEVYGRRNLTTRFGEVSVATKADAVHGNVGGEWKTTEKSIQIRKYMDSVQWKLCCWALHLRAIDYRIVKLKQTDDGSWTVVDSDQIQMLWCDSLMDEIIWLIDGLIDFHHTQELSEYLVPYYQRQKAA